MSKVRKCYIIRLVGRCVVFVLCGLLWLWKPQAFSVLEGMNFFAKPSVLHLLWLIWVADMVCQIIPLKNEVPLGSQKLFANRFRPIREKINQEALRSYIISTPKAAYKVLILWCGLMIGILY